MAQKRAVIGIFGLPGSGKSFLLAGLKRMTNERDFTLVEGSSKIASFFGEEGLKGFKLLDEEMKYQIREWSIQAIGKEADNNGCDAIVTGHYSFWGEGEPEPLEVWTDADARTYTNIIYLRVNPAKIHERRRTDAVTIRPQVSVEHLKKWQDLEVQSLRRLCAQNNILFIELQEEPHFDFRVSRICDLHRPSSERMNNHNAVRSDPPLDNFAADGIPTERLFRDQGYSLFAFQQAALLYDEPLDILSFQDRCREVATRTKLYPELETLVREACMRKDVLVMIVTSGITTIWAYIMDDLAIPRSSRIAVLVGALRLMPCPLVITPEVKGLVASHLRDIHGLDVWAFGDSPIDIPMLKAANHAVVVVGPEESRSRSMDGALSEALSGGLRAKQLLLPHDVPPRLDLERLPRVSVEDIMADLQCSKTLELLHATDKEACKLLASPTRDPSISGPDLKRPTARIGQYLALEYLGKVLGLAETPSQTVQGTPTMSHSLRDEAATAIVAIMRAGEPLAEGIFDVFPRARFIHARAPADLTARELEGVRAVLLVDTVINTGETIIEFVRHLRGLGLKLVVVASVVQAETIQKWHPMATALAEADAPLVTLRVSENKYKGTRGLDTGNRMFNTTHRD
ncbi:Uracil phosphoribosyltransferase [Escovopsis weberi]|uniref:Uracil phosphoribosyltransferase n=1 Tax=Escovopsis weberi TaxID=150374 RepID=A0A0M8MZ85_ESCWE|nr:Uracil phosphoribosyltransferase [Escovopsis weberi]